MRVVSLLPAATELICALGAGRSLVGRSHECDFPSEIASVPVMTRARSSLAGTSGRIDAAVRAAVEQALALYEVDAAALRRADPDLIVTQDLCDVCAVSMDTLQTAVRDWIRPQTRIAALHPTRLVDVWRDVERLAALLGLAGEGHRLRSALESRLEQLARRTASFSERPRVLNLEWLEPMMIGGLWMPELIEIAGGAALVTGAGEPAPTLTREQLAGLHPEVVLIKPCGFDLRRATEELDRLGANLGLPGAPRVYVADGNAYFNRSGPRLVESAEILAACLHPQAADLAERHAAAFRRYRTPTA